MNTKHQTQNFDKASCYDLQWQRLRLSLKGRFGDLEGLTDVMCVLDAYVSSVHCSDTPIRYKRVMNLLAATMLGYGNKPMFSKHKQVLQLYHACLSKWFNQNYKAEYEKLALQEWDWDAIEDQLACCSDWPFLVHLQQDLRVRKNTSLRRNGHMKHRQDLVTFMAMLDQELIYRETTSRG